MKLGSFLIDVASMKLNTAVSIIYNGWYCKKSNFEIHLYWLDIFPIFQNESNEKMQGINAPQNF